MKKLCTIFAALTLVVLCFVLMPAEGHAAEGEESYVEFTVDSLKLPDQSFSAGTATVGGVGVEWIQLGNYGDGIQMRDKDGKTSMFWNTTAIPGTITKIEFVYSDSKNTYNNDNCMQVKFGNAVQGADYSTTLTTVADTKEYTITPNGDYSFFYIEWDFQYSSYWKSIKVYYSDSTEGGSDTEEDTVTVVASGTCGSSLSWELYDNGTLTISGTGAMEYFYSISYVPWYSNRTLIKNVVIGEGVTSIGQYAFDNCTSLTSVTIPNSVTSIGDYAFENCTGLTSVSITDIAAWCSILFCKRYSDDLPYSNPLYYAKKLYLNSTLVTELVIPDSVTSIGTSAFYNCTSLTSVTIPDSVTSIGSWAFYGCIRLKTFEIPNSVTSIGSSAFESCTNLTNVTIPDSVTSIGYSAFSSCTSLTSVTIPDSVTSIGNYAFYDCDSLTSVDIPDSVTSIGSYSFYYCDGLTSVTIGNSVTSIGRSAFYDCDSLTSVNITDVAAWCNISFDNHYSNPLYHAEKLYLNGTLVTELVIPDGVTSIGSYAFSYCSNLTSVTIPDSVTSIGSSAFQSCDSLTGVTIGDGVTNISNSAFYCCDKLKEILLPKGMDTIDSNAFLGCSRLETVYHKGDQDDWDWIVINTGNDYLKNANIIHNFAGDTIPGVCNHQWQAATCTTAKTCTLCGRVEGTAPGHSWVDATCLAPKTCTACGSTEGQALGHLLRITSEAKEPTCTENGWTFGLECVNDGCTYQVSSKPWKANGHSYTNGFCAGCGEKDPNGPPVDENLKFFNTPGLSFQTYIGMQILAKNDTFTGYDKFYVTISQVTPDGVVESTTQGMPYLGKYTVFEQQIVSWSMTETVTMTLYGEKDGIIYEGASITTTVKDLAMSKLATYKAQNDMARCQALVDMLNYGAAVQSAYDYNANDLANADLGEYAELGTQDAPGITADNNITGTNQIKVYSANISLQDKVEFQFMVKTSALNGKTVVATLNGDAQDVVYEKYNSYTIIRVAAAAAHMRDTYTIVINDANGNPVTCTYNVSVEAYTKEQLGGDRAAALIAMMKYGDSVAAIG